MLASFDIVAVLDIDVAPKLKILQERLSSGIEVVGDEEIARSLLAACRGRPEPVLAVYEQLLSNGAIVPSQHLRLRLLRSVLVVLREWVMSVLADKLGTTTSGASFMFGGASALEQTSVIQRGIRDKIASATNRFELLSYLCDVIYLRIKIIHNI